MAERQQNRRAAILASAFEAFSRYGFKRTSIDDIARSAKVPRTAVYRLFRGKEDIFTELVEQTHQAALEAARREIESRRAFAMRIENALLARDIYLLEVGHSGPHASEVADLYESLASDLTRKYNLACEELLLAATREAVRGGEYQLPATCRSAAVFVRLLRLSLEGIKKEVAAADEFRALARQAIRTILASPASA